MDVPRARPVGLHSMLAGSSGKNCFLDSLPSFFVDFSPELLFIEEVENKYDISPFLKGLFN